MSMLLTWEAAAEQLAVFLAPESQLEVSTWVGLTLEMQSLMACDSGSGGAHVQEHHHHHARQNGGDAYTGASGSANGGSAATLQGGLLNVNALNFGGNGGRGGASISGDAVGGMFTACMFRFSG